MFAADFRLELVRPAAVHALVFILKLRGYKLLPKIILAITPVEKRAFAAFYAAFFA